MKRREGVRREKREWKGRMEKGKDRGGRGDRGGEEEEEGKDERKVGG